MMKMLLSVGILLLVLGGCQPENSETEAVGEALPNVLLIVVDDQGFADMSTIGRLEDVETPNIDRLAAQSVRFTNAYATSPICSPSRAGILTGSYHQRWGTWWYGGPGIHDDNYQTIAELLRDQGYATGYIGKVHYGAHDSDTTNRSFPLNHGFDYYFGHTSARKHYLIHNDEKEEAFMAEKQAHERQGQSLRQQALWENTNRVDTMTFSTELFGIKACKYIETHQEEPFFLQLSFNAVHNFTHQLPEEYLNQHNLNGYHDWDPATEDYYEWYESGRKPNNPEGRAHYLGQLHYLDQEIGRVLKCLDSAGIAENTLIVYVSDNGGSTPIYADNTPLRGSKYLLYEGGIRVPMMFSFPGRFQAGIVNETNMVSQLDILPTVLTAANVEPPTQIDGFDLTALLEGSDQSVAHDTLIWDTGHETAVRAGKWKLKTAASNEHAIYEMVELELGEFLYDLESDPGESRNVADQYPEVMSKLQQAHERWRDEMVD